MHVLQRQQCPEGRVGGVENIDVGTVLAVADTGVPGPAEKVFGFDPEVELQVVFLGLQA
ncbi:hypothetical protein D3C86_1878860 [compost metagenome]